MKSEDYIISYFFMSRVAYGYMIISLFDIFISNIMVFNFIFEFGRNSDLDPDTRIGSENFGFEIQNLGSMLDPNPNLQWTDRL